MRRLAIPLLIAIAALLCAGLAAAELSQNGNLRLHFSGKIAPKKLPRTNAAPVTVRISGAIGTADGQRPPELNKIAIAFNRYGQRLDPGPADLRSGRTRADDLAERPRSLRRRPGRPRQVQSERGAARARDLSRSTATCSPSTRARTASRRCCSIYTGRNPVQLVFVLTFRIVRVKKGTFGTIFVARIPKIASQLGYVTNVNLTFGRRYTYQGQQRSFLSARCAAPAGFPGAIFTLARGSFSFDNGQRISTSLARNCWVR